MTESRKLRVFLCHASQDKPIVRELYRRLLAEGWIDPWLDEEKLLPGQDWNLEIEKAAEAADAVIVCISNNSVTKEGYIQRELRFVLNVADEKPEGTIFIIPLRLDDCELPRRMRLWQFADYFEEQREHGYQRLLITLRMRKDLIDLKGDAHLQEHEKQNRIISERQPVSSSKHPTPEWIAENKITFSNNMEFMCVPHGKFLMGSDNHNDNEKPQHTIDIPYGFWMARYPVTNEQYYDYIKFNEGNHPVSEWEKKKDHPVGYVKWIEAMGYCHWLNRFLENELPPGLILRLPTEAEWEKAARGVDAREYPWGNQFDKYKCNTSEGDKDSTSSVGHYSPQGDSPYGCADMAGNVWEWTQSIFNYYPYSFTSENGNENAIFGRILRGGSFIYNLTGARCAFRFQWITNFFLNYGIGFRLVLAPPLPK